MHQHKRLAIFLTLSLSLVAGIWMPNPQAKAPPSSCGSEKTSKDLEDPQTEKDLCSDTHTMRSESTESIPVLQRYDTLLQHIEAVELKIKKKLNGKPHWEEALKQASQAAKLGASSASSNPTIDTLHNAKSLWEEAIATLREIPPGTDYSDRATDKIKQYQGYLDDISYRLEVAQSDFLIPIAERSGLSSQVKITICHLYSGICRHLRGNEPARDAASLMKVPIAVALMNKLMTEKIRLDNPIYVDPANYTEDASDIRVGETYPIERVLAETIAHSSNIAPNQIIDYLGWDYINQVLEQRGYEVTRVYSKFVGDFTYPHNPGIGRNQLTSDELTTMMIRIYNREHLGDEILIRALEGQYDHELGFEGLKGGFGNWLGEKTGQTSRVLGTTLAMNLFGETYIITVIDDGNYSEPSIRQFISEISEYIFRSGQL